MFAWASADRACPVSIVANILSCCSALCACSNEPTSLIPNGRMCEELINNRASKIKIAWGVRWFCFVLPWYSPLALVVQFSQVWKKLLLCFSVFFVVVVGKNTAFVSSCVSRRLMARISLNTYFAMPLNIVWTICFRACCGGMELKSAEYQQEKRSRDYFWHWTLFHT